MEEWNPYESPVAQQPNVRRKKLTAAQLLRRAIILFAFCIGLFFIGGMNPLLFGFRLEPETPEDFAYLANCENFVFGCWIVGGTCFFLSILAVVMSVFADEQQDRRVS